MSATHLAIVLAAGGSRRLGRAKQLLTRDGETLIHRAVRLAIASAPRSTIVVLGAQRDAMAAALADLHCDIANNAAWQHGLAGSLRIAAASIGLPAAAHDTPVLILGCDQPALQLSHLQTLLDGASQAASRIAATRHGRARGTPVVVPAAMLSDMVVDRSDTGSAGELGANADRGLGAQLRDMAADAMFVLDAPELRRDIDTDDDVRDAIAHGWLDADTQRS